MFRYAHSFSQVSVKFVVLGALLFLQHVPCAKPEVGGREYLEGWILESDRPRSESVLCLCVLGQVTSPL